MRVDARRQTRPPPKWVSRPARPEVGLQSDVQGIYDLLNGDMNDDGFVDGSDIQPFFDLLGG